MARGDQPRCLRRLRGVHHEDLGQGLLGQRDHPGERAEPVDHRHLPEPAGEPGPRQDLRDPDHRPQLPGEDPRPHRRRALHGRPAEVPHRRGRRPGHDTRQDHGRGSLARSGGVARCRRCPRLPPGRPPGRGRAELEPGARDPEPDHEDRRPDRPPREQRRQQREAPLVPPRAGGAHRPARLDRRGLGPPERQRQPLRPADRLLDADPSTAGVEHRGRRDARPAARNDPRLAPEPSRSRPPVVGRGRRAARRAGAGDDPPAQALLARGRSPLRGLRRAAREPGVPFARPGDARRHGHELQPRGREDVGGRRTRLCGRSRRE